MKFNTLCWLLLIVLTVAGVAVSGAEMGSGSNGIILGAALIKTGAVSWRFMELGGTHMVWKSGFLLFMAGMLGMIFFLA